MSKKNNRAIKARYHNLTLEREKEAAAKKQQKAEKKAQREATIAKVAGPSRPIAKKRKGGIRIRKGVTIKGIKVVDAASKKRAREVLQREKRDREMDVDLPAKQPKLLKKKEKKAKATATDGPVPMD